MERPALANRICAVTTCPILCRECRYPALRRIDSGLESRRSRFDFPSRIVQQLARNRRSVRAMLADRGARNSLLLSNDYPSQPLRCECYLCNTWPKTLRGDCFCSAPLLPVQGPWVMVCVRRRGASRSRPVWVFRYKSLALMRGCPKSAKRSDGRGTKGTVLEVR